MSLAPVFLVAICGCDPCAGLVSGPSPPPLTLAVRDAGHGLLLADATAVGMDANVTCTQGRCSLSRRQDDMQPWRYQITVSATGYESKNLVGIVPRVEPEGCFAIDYEPVELEVLLDPGS